MSENKLLKHKYVEIFADSLSTGVWNIDGSNDDLENLPVSQEIITEIESMNAAYDRDNGTWDSNLETQHDYILWSYKIALKIKEELPDWTVTFVNTDYKTGEDNYLDLDTIHYVGKNGSGKYKV